jgi:amino acid transporter
MATKPPKENQAPAGEPGEVLATTQLQVRALGLTGALMQNITAIAPAITAFFFTATIVGFTGAISPFAYFLGFLVVLALGTCLVQLAKLFPSAGGYFTYVSRTLGPRAGFLTGWAYTLYSPIIAGPILAFFGYILQGELQANYGITFPWWVFSLIAIPVIAVLGFYGIKLSVRAIVVLGGLEFLIVLALGLSGLISPGPGGFTVRVFDPGFNPGHLATATGFALAIVFSVQGLTGWESAVPLAEETANPRRNVPIATMASIVITGVMTVVVIWGQVIGWGWLNIAKLPGSAELPALVIAHRVWGAAWSVALFAMFTSVMAASLATQNVATRMWYGMARTGVLPRVVAHVDPKRKTPTVAVLLQFLLSMGLAFIGGGLLGPASFFILMVGFCLVLAVIFVYSMGNIGVVVHYWRHRRREFNWVLHFVFPVGTTAILIYSLVKSFSPFPASPDNWSPVIVGAWMLVGVGVLVVLKVRGGETWLQKAGEIIDSQTVTAEGAETITDDGDGDGNQN